MLVLFFARDVLGDPTATVGPVLSTVNVLLGALAALLFPIVSAEEPAATVIPTVPSPVQPERVTVAAAVSPLVTALLQVALPVVFSVTSVESNENEVPPVKVTLKVTLVPFLTAAELGLPMETVGPVLSTTKVPLALLARF
jgi:hypothetical protein